MLRTRTVVGLVLATAVFVFAVGLPWLWFQKHPTPAQYVADEVATTEEIQEFDLMWNHLETLQKQSAELGPQQYKKQFVASTTAYLQLNPEQKEKFREVVDEGLLRLAEAKSRLANSRKQRQQQANDPGESPQDDWSGESPDSIAIRRNAWSQWRDDQRETSDLLLSALQPNPRHKLLAERRLLWLLKLDFSLREAGK